MCVDAMRGAFLFWGLGGLCWVCLRPFVLHGSSIFEFLVPCCLQPLGCVMCKKHCNYRETFGAMWKHFFNPNERECFLRMFAGMRSRKKKTCFPAFLTCDIVNYSHMSCRISCAAGWHRTIVCCLTLYGILISTWLEILVLIESAADVFQCSCSLFLIESVAFLCYST